jgi:hypothetical protein
MPVHPHAGTGMPMPCLRDAHAGIRSPSNPGIRNTHAGLPSRVTGVRDARGSCVWDSGDEMHVLTYHGSWMPVPDCSSHAGVRDTGAEMHVLSLSGSRMPVPYCSSHAGVRDAVAGIHSTGGSCVRDSGAEMPVHPYSGTRMPVPYYSFNAGVRDADGSAPSSDAGVRDSGAEMPMHSYSGARLPVPFSHSDASVRDAQAGVPSHIPSLHSGAWNSSGAGYRSSADASVSCRTGVRHAHLQSPGPPPLSMLAPLMVNLTC